MAGNNIIATNSFEGGMVSDLHEMASPNNSVTDALNMEIITVADKQFIFQNIRGNKHIVDLPTHTDNNSTYRFIPLGVKVSNNIAYILAGAFDSAGEFLTGMIGTFPSPNWVDELNPKGVAVLENVFRPLHNYKELGISEEYDQPFISKFFKFKKNRHIEMEIQGDFDNSVNILFSDNNGNPSIINSRFKRTDSAIVVELADREGSNDGNVYSDNDWDRIALIQNTNYPVEIGDFEILPGGYLRGGGYKYYFKYITQEGNTTEILYESPLIPIANGGLGLTKDQISDKMVRFPVSGLDSSYSGIQVYFAHFDGEDAAIMEVFKINYVYSYGGDDSIVLTHTGLEDVTLVDSAEINVTFTPVDTAKSIAIINDRLAIAGASSTIKGEDLSILEAAALDVKLWERSTIIEGDYSDPELASTKLGYWKGEVYEFAVVFLLTNKGLSPAFPITGFDNIDGKQEFFNGAYPEYELNDDGFSVDEFGKTDSAMFNSKGIFRTANSGIIYVPECEGPSRRYVTYLEADTSSFDGNGPLNKLVSGFFVVRRPRVKNVLMQGMMIPTLKVPSKAPSLAEFGKGVQTSWDANKRFTIKHWPVVGNYPTIGLNGPYEAAIKDGKPIFNDQFDTVFVPQPTQLINVLTFEKSWTVSGGIGQTLNSTVFGNTIDNKGEDQNKMHVAFYSCEIDLNFNTIKGHLNGINPGIEVQGLLNGASPLGHTYTGKKFSSTSNTVVSIAEKVSLNRSSFLTLDANDIKANILDSGTQIFTNQGFTGKIDRSIGFLSDNFDENVVDPEDPDKKQAFYGLPYHPYIAGTTIYDYNIMHPNSRHDRKNDNIFHDGSDFFTYSLMSQSYSRFIGFEIDTKINPGPSFNYHRHPSGIAASFPNGADAVACVDDITESTYVNTGHLTNVFRSSTGRWNTDDIINIFRYDSNKAYNAITSRFPLDKASTNIFGGDGFISKIFKRISYKNGIKEAQSATPSDAKTYGIGTVERHGDGTNPEDIDVFEVDDNGRNLFDVGQIIEIVSYSNINADIRSVERLTPEDSALYGGDRDFYPNKQHLFGDARPDSTVYNHGYTGDSNPVSYHRIEENSPIFNTEFPNRVLLSERNKTQSFFNSFRDLKGFNYRDYGVELGPIIKIMAVKNVLLSIHPDGVLAIGIDDRTLIAEGSDVFVNTAESLSPKAANISEIYGSQHAESIVRTDTTVAGVDYASSAVWMFEGDKLTIISEFAIKTVLNHFKETIEGGNLKPGDEGITYLPRVYSTFNHSKHTLYIAYIAENPSNRNQIHVGSVSYNTVMGKWSSRLSEGNKFEMSIGSLEYTTGFSTTYGIWQEDALTDETGKQLRTRIRDVDYRHEFTIVINKEPSLEKILDNIRMICNKSLPVNIEYTTSGDSNDAAVNIWNSDSNTKVLDQPIITRNSSPRNSLRLGILDENAYYKNSNLYIEVGKINSISRKSRGNKRIRDKNIKVRFIYTGNDETFIQGIISILSISHS